MQINLFAEKTQLERLRGLPRDNCTLLRKAAAILGLTTSSIYEIGV